MATYNFYLDCRNNKKCDPPFPLKIRVTNRRKTAYIPTNFNLMPDQWSQEGQRVKKHPKKDSINRYLKQLAVKIDNAFIDLCTVHEILFMDAKEIAILLKNKIYDLSQTELKVEHTKYSLLTWFEKCIATKKDQTRKLYEGTLSIVKKYKSESELGTLRFETIKKEWLVDFDNWMADHNLATNTRGIHMRNLRHVFNYAIDNDITKNYPFRRFSIKHAKTPKRNIDIETLRAIFNYECKTYRQQRYLDAFKLSFMLIGINIKDLCLLDKINDGFIEFNRSKTKALYSIKAEPEAIELIEKYKGKKKLLNYMDTYKEYRSFYRHLAACLRELKREFGLKSLTTYYARHSWATIASRLEIPKETIAAALGHSDKDVTDIYIDFDMTKVDIANRKVLDYVLYGKEE